MSENECIVCVLLLTDCAEGDRKQSFIIPKVVYQLLKEDKTVEESGY